MQPASPAPARFLVNTSPVGATVIVEGKVLGTSPLIVNGKPGETKKLRLSLTGYDDKDVTIELGDEDRKAQFQLRPHAVVEDRSAKKHKPSSDHAKRKPLSKPSDEGAVNPW